MSIRAGQELSLLGQANAGVAQSAGMVMVVDDNADNLELLEILLSAKGFEVIKATGGEIALKLLDTVQPDVILMDAMMPGLDGFETIRRIRARQDLPYIPIVMLTALQDNKSRLTSLESGADEFLSKPFSQPELLVRTRSLVRLRRYNQALQQAVDDNRYLNELLATENIRMAQELNRTREAQLRLMPQSGPNYPGVSFAVHYKPALEVGGDYYDYFRLDEQRFVVVLGDAVGKGGAAVLAVAIIKSLVAAQCSFAAKAGIVFEPDQLLSRINEVICGPLMSSQTEMTLFCGLVDLEKRTLRFSNAGQTFPFLVRPGAVQEVKLSGLPIGLFSEAEYQRAEISFQPGDRLVLYSDGINEATNIHSEQYGLDRLAETLLKTANLTPEIMLNYLLLELNQFCADAGDDQTMVIFGF